jgi:hypothetical protein
MNRLSVLLALWATVAVACAPAHVQLVEPPAQAAPVDERVAFYRAHRPVAVSAAPASVLLADGQRVFQPADLLPQLDSEAPAASAARRAAADADTAEAWHTFGWTAAASGGALELAGGGVAIGMLLGAPQAEQTLTPPVVGALAVAVVGAVVAIVGVTVGTLVAVGPSQSAARDTETAFLTFDSGLRRRLALADDDLLPRRRVPGAPATAPVSPPQPVVVDDTAQASPAKPAQAHLTVGPLPASCPDEQVLRAGVVARLGRDPFVDTHDDVITVTAVEVADQLEVTVGLHSGGVAMGVRTQAGASNTCTELFSRAALSIAMLLDPLAPSDTSAPLVVEPAP